MDRIFQNIQDYAKIEDKNIEIEVKFRELNRGDYLFLIDYLKRKYSEFSNSYTIDYYLKNNQRISEKEDVYSETSKKQLFSDFYRKLKFTVSEEKEEILDITTPPNFEFKRSKDRISFKVDNFLLDLTYIEENEKYEFEIEVIDHKKYNWTTFKKIVTFFQNLLLSYKEDLISLMNSLLSEGRVKNNKFINRSLISRPRDLKKADLISTDSILNNFTVSVKADGIQYFLLFHKSGIWLYSPSRGLIKVCHLSEEYQDLDGTLYIGELLEERNLKEGETLSSKYMYLPFDCLGYKGKSIISENYLSRIERVKDIVEKELFCDGSSILKVEEKKIFSLGDNSESFYKNFNECFEYVKSLVYKDDGFIFTPIDSPFVAKGQFQKSGRILSNVLDVCKFKPVEKRSLDFLVKDGFLYLYTGNDLKKFNSVSYSLDFPGDIDDKIVEFFPKISPDGIKLIPERIRYDKEYPNTVAIADEIVKSYYEKNPVTIETLLGKDTVLMRSYNNMEKRKLLKNAKDYVVDIGSGKGGDIDKYSSNTDIEKVLLIEPNSDYYSELLDRLKTSKKKNIFDTLLSKGESTDLIINKLETFLPQNMKNRTITITFMISLTFFWANEKELNKLISTISAIQALYKKRNGNKKLIILYYTIDGYKVEKFFDYKIGSIKKLNTITMSLVGKNQVFISIKDSKTVEEQTEYLVRLDQFFDKIKFQEDFQKEPLPPSNLLMSNSEREYLSLHTFGGGKISGNISVSISPLKRLKVSETEAFYDSENKLIAIGDDVTEKIYYLDPNIRRLSCLNMNISVIHSILKLTNREYRYGDIFKRSNLAQEKYKTLETIRDIEYLSKKFGVGIKVFYGNKTMKYGNDNSEWILLNQCDDMSYEPLIFLDGKIVFYTFEKNSYLI